ncbi:hypothetical protein V7S43_004518 [Phytophthora oleae]|uniref:DUF4246 domain-containing protein n=1 Tax=Phytophthora oleae TaxID=2107226 RepID=A0ABD3FWZ4_9STRA
MEPRPLFELNTQQAISSILQKPRWWIKSQDPEIRQKWWNEIEQQLLLKTFDQSLVMWSHGQEPLRSLIGLLDEENGPEKHAKLREWLKGILTEFGMDAESDEEDSDESVDKEDAEEEKNEQEQKDSAQLTEGDKRLRALKQEVEAEPSYATVKWMFNQLLLHERMSVVPVEEWSQETVGAVVTKARSVKSPELVLRATEFVLAVRRGVSVEEALPIPPGSDLLTADRLLKLKLHCEKIHRELTAVWMYMTNVLLLVAEREGLTAETELDQVVICPGGIDGVWISDNVIPEDVATKFKSEVSVLENVPDNEKDWHPDSDNQVLDLVHPSLFCCVFGTTLRASTALDPSSYTTPAEQMNELMFTGVDLVEQPNGCNSDYQWIPTDFYVSEGGEPGVAGEIEVRCLSYINNLHPEKHVGLYDSIQQILGRFVPLFERMLSDRAAGMLPATFDVDMMNHEPSRELPLRPRVPDVVEPEEETMISLRGKTVQVIVKIAEIILTLQKPTYSGGAWHMEGTSAEKIVGTGIYYFGSENIKNSRLAFRTEVEEPPYQQNDIDGVAEIYGLFDEEFLEQDLGSVESAESRCVVFSNWLQHRVQPFTLEDPSKPGVRKILAFFLVDPENLVPSTAVIPPQQEEWITPALKGLIQELQFPDVVEMKIQSMLPGKMPFHAAEHHRLQLMEERAAAQDSSEDAFGNSRYFSLCEH